MAYLNLPAVQSMRRLNHVKAELEVNATVAAKGSGLPPGLLAEFVKAGLA